jgi:hypothetical protein
MSLPILYPFIGAQYNRPSLQIVNWDGTVASGIYTSGSTLSATLWEGQSQASLFSPTVSWYTAGSTQTGYTQGQFSWSVSAAQTATSVNPAGEYYTLVSQTTGGQTSPVWQGRVKFLATPGSTTPQPPDLASYDYCEGYCSELNLTDSQRDFLPYFVTAASMAIRRLTYCNFDLRTYVKKFDIALNGTVRLDQVPVQAVLRVQGPQQLALTVSNTSTTCAYAQCYFAYSGQYDGYGSNAQTITGLTLNYMVGGALTTYTVPISTGQTVSSLATAINSYGNGWSALADTTLGPMWAATELDGGYTGQGCGVYSSVTTGAQFYLLQDLAPYQVDNPWRGFLYTGRIYQDSDAGRWGPGGSNLFGGTGNYSSNGQADPGQARVTFVAGESTIPGEIQMACAELVKWKLGLAKQELLLKMETAADYSYTLADQMVANVPTNVRQMVAPFRIHYA